ncbi:MAG: DUF2505 family protein [bacterium]
MAKKSEQTFRLSYPADVVLKVLTNDEFLVANFKQQDNPAAVVRERSRTDTKLVLECEVTEYSKGMTGVDRSRTEVTQTVYEWDLKARRSSWTYDSPHGNRIKVWGQTRIEEAGSGCVVHEEFNCDVKIPLVGGKVEKIVLKEVDKYWPLYEKLLKEWASKLA